MFDKYNHKTLEPKIYQYWLDNDCFKANAKSHKKPFTISMPPPNITGQLHMGHALDQTIQDILTRYKRMQGFEALWLPGTDHAGIATQIKVEETLRNDEGKTRHDLGRDAFLERVWEWKEKYGNRINEQIQKLGSSCDWSHERFTMDDDYANAVKEVFVKLYNENLIYQGSRIINWCPNCITALSDAEVEYTEKDGAFWHIKYPLVGEDIILPQTDTNEQILSTLTKDAAPLSSTIYQPSAVIIATTRPETLLGDTAVAVNPADPRYSHLIGKNLLLPLVNREIPIVADEHAELGKGTGAVKITPAHDPNDFEVGLRHNLPVLRIMDDNAKINDNSKYHGMDRYEARKAILADLEEQGYLVKTEPHTHSVGQCYRCGTTVEPIISKQWFVKMPPLAAPAINIVKSQPTTRTKIKIKNFARKISLHLLPITYYLLPKQKDKISFVPQKFEKTYLNWMENIHDWCISRQLWWGHRIPAFYCDVCGETTVSKDDVTTCPKCGGSVRQDEDVLDTWFSSALWPFATLGYPEQTDDLAKFYPNDVLVTGYDIIFFWVARMIFSGLHHTGKKPFKDVLIHGIVRDEQGRKMSKSLGNGIDPLDIIDKYGADALRAALISGVAPGNDMRFSHSKTESFSHFANKLWNAARFVHMNTNPIYTTFSSLHSIGDEPSYKQDGWYSFNEKAKSFGADIGSMPPHTSQSPNDTNENNQKICENLRASASSACLNIEDKWLLHKLNLLIADVTENMEKYELGIAFDKIYSFIWDEFCDWYIEMVKPRLTNNTRTAPTTTSAPLPSALCPPSSELQTPQSPLVGADNIRPQMAQSHHDNAQSPTQFLSSVLCQLTAVLHPFMPFITEEIFGQFNNTALITSPFPTFNPEWVFEEEHQQVETLKEIITQIRNKRAEINAHPAKLAKLYIDTDERHCEEQSSVAIQPHSQTDTNEHTISTPNTHSISNSSFLTANFFSHLAKASEIIFAPKSAHPTSNAFTFLTQNTTITMETGNIIDLDKKRKMLQDEITKCQKEIDFNEKMLNNPSFVEKAPAPLIAEKRQKLADFHTTLTTLQAQLKEMNNE